MVFRSASPLAGSDSSWVRTSSSDRTSRLASTTDRWDNGEWDVDGLRSLASSLAATKVDIFGARTSDNTDSQGIQVQPMFAVPGGIYFSGGGPGFGSTGAITNEVDQLLGLHAWIPLGTNGDINLSYVILDSNAGFVTATGTGNQVMDWGGDLKYNFDKFRVEAGYSRTDTYFDSHSINTTNDQRMTGMLSYHAPKWGAGLGYNYIEPYFAAPGYWERIGTWWNPTDIEGIDARAHIDVTDALSLHGQYRYYTGTGKVTGGIPTSSHVQAINADLRYKFGSASTFTLGVRERYRSCDWLHGHSV